MAPAPDEAGPDERRDGSRPGCDGVTVSLKRFFDLFPGEEPDGDGSLGED